MNRQTAKILLIEDSPTDVLLAQEALSGSKFVDALSTVADGVQALKFLRRQAGYEEVARPDLILLDLNLPKKDGREVLAELKNDGDLKRIPVVILSTSQSEADIFQAYGLHANCYIVKPVDFDKFSDVVRQIETFWFSVATLPGQA